MARMVLIAAQVFVTILFIMGFQTSTNVNWLGLLAPMLLIVLVVMNSLRPTRLVCWVIFSVAFFGLLAVLSAFTIGWRTEQGFSPAPFYRAMLMYATFVYISLGQLKLNVGGGNSSSLTGGT